MFAGKVCAPATTREQLTPRGALRWDSIRDEDQPRMIEDADAVKPADWNEEEPMRIPDPTSPKPAEWNEEDDGEWEAPMVGASLAPALPWQSTDSPTPPPLMPTLLT